MESMFEQLEEIGRRPEPFETYTAEDLWTDGHISKQMLACHLDPEVDVSSRRGEFIDRSVEWIASRFNVGTGTRIADYGCGPGLYSNRLARLGAHVTGIDFSERSVRYAREAAGEQGLKVDYVNGNYLDFETEERFHLIMMIMCDFCALSPARRMLMLKKFHSQLLPGGSLLLDVYSLNAFRQRRERTTFGKDLMDGFWSAEKYFGFLSTFRYEDEKVVLDKYTIVQANRMRVICNWLQYFSPESLRIEFGTAGFHDRELYGDVAGAPFDETASEFAVAASKGRNGAE